MIGVVGADQSGSEGIGAIGVIGADQGDRSVSERIGADRSGSEWIGVIGVDQSRSE